MNEKTSKVTGKYFAAANTYHGFVSFFDKTFASKDYSRIYVLKGGPGTGKSSFMKKVSAHFQNKNCYIEEIYCSSDPHSLDGVIITKSGKKIAIIDGTAPHERDAVIPGAIDEIVNLGEGWDSRILEAQRDDILSLGKEKSSSYKSGYNYLSIAGKAWEYIISLHRENFDEFCAKNKAEIILQDITHDCECEVITRLISSFGRYGSYRLDTLNELNSRIITVGGSEPASVIFLNLCVDVLMNKRANILRLPCALDPSHTDAIYLPDQELTIARSGDGEINADEFVNLSVADRERIKVAQRIHDDTLDEAKRWFAIASDMHFRLEEIYGRAMNFDKNNQILDEKIIEIQNILENV